MTFVAHHWLHTPDHLDATMAAYHPLALAVAGPWLEAYLWPKTHGDMWLLAGMSL